MTRKIKKNARRRRYTYFTLHESNSSYFHKRFYEGGYHTHIYTRTQIIGERIVSYSYEIWQFSGDRQNKRDKNEKLGSLPTSIRRYHTFFDHMELMNCIRWSAVLSMLEKWLQRRQKEQQKDERKSDNGVQLKKLWYCRYCGGKKCNSN